MTRYFAKTAGLETVSQSGLKNLFETLAPSAFVELGRPQYLPLDVDEVRLWLARTLVDRNVWRQADDVETKTEFVCASFSLLLWGLSEQERLRSGCVWPLALGRIRLLSDAGGHSLCAFLGSDGEGYMLEPQNDQVVRWEEYFEEAMNTTAQSIIFV